MANLPDGVLLGLALCSRRLTWLPVVFGQWNSCRSGRMGEHETGLFFLWYPYRDKVPRVGDP